MTEEAAIELYAGLFINEVLPAKSFITRTQSMIGSPALGLQRRAELARL